METAPPPTDQAQTSLPPDIFGALLETLGVPADQVTPEAILNAAKALQDKAAQVDQLNATLVDVQGKLSALQADAQARQAADLDNELAGYEIPDEPAAVVRTLPPEQRKPILAAMPQKKAAAPATTATSAAPAKPATPPPPVHDPKAAAPAKPDDKAAQAEQLIAKIRKTPGSKFATYEAARAEARRQQPDLFS